MHQVPVDEVLFFQAQDKYVRVVTAEGEALIAALMRHAAQEHAEDRAARVAVRDADLDLAPDVPPDERSTPTTVSSGTRVSAR